MMWRVMRASDDLNNADSWNAEILVLKGLVLTALVIFTPAALYGGQHLSRSREGVSISLALPPSLSLALARALSLY